MMEPEHESSVTFEELDEHLGLRSSMGRRASQFFAPLDSSITEIANMLPLKEITGLQFRRAVTSKLDLEQIVRTLDGMQDHRTKLRDVLVGASMLAATKEESEEDAQRREAMAATQAETVWQELVEIISTGIDSYFFDPATEIACLEAKGEVHEAALNEYKRYDALRTRSLGKRTPLDNQHQYERERYEKCLTSLNNRLKKIETTKRKIDFYKRVSCKLREAIESGPTDSIDFEDDDLNMTRIQDIVSSLKIDERKNAILDLEKV